MDWLALVKGMKRSSRAVIWIKTVKDWQTTEYVTLDAQAKWLCDWIGRVQVTSGSPTELHKYVQQAPVLLLRWTEA